VITERALAPGDWQLTLRPDTPLEIRQKIVGFGQIVVMPTIVAEQDMSDDQLENARYAGVIVQPGPYFRIGGHGLAMFLGTSDRAYGSGIAANAFTNIVFPASSSFTSAITSAVGNCGLSVGTLTDPSGGTYYNGAYHYAKHRTVLDAVCRFYDAEWRINPDGSVDAAAFDTLYPAPTTVVTRRPGGRVIGGVGIEALIDASADLWKYASRVVLRGQTQTGAYGGVSSEYRAFDGQWLSAVAEQDASDLDGDLDFAAALLAPKLAHPHRTVTVSTDAYDFAGDVAAGSRIYVYDPGAGVVDASTSTNNSVEWQGEHIKPMAFRALAVTWPVRDGMSVYVRRYTGSGVTGTVEYVDLTPHFQPETGATRIDVGYHTSQIWEN
jgi:hypothetical protein